MIPLKQRLNIVKTNVANAALKVGRLPEEIKLVAVTKTVGAKEIKELISLGVMDVGENRVQDAKDKFDEVGDFIRWHMIGRLQKNKVKDAVKFCNFIHSVDSVALASEINKEAVKNDKIIDVFVQVNVSGEDTKQGVNPDDLIFLVEEISVFENIKVSGLMTMAPFSSNPEDSRPIFRRLRELRKLIIHREIPNVKLRHLSMGMSQDYEVAIEEGATVVRVGSAIVG